MALPSGPSCHSQLPGQPLGAGGGAGTQDPAGGSPRCWGGHPGCPRASSRSQAQAEQDPRAICPSPAAAFRGPRRQDAVSPAPPALGLFLGLLCNSPASLHGEEGLLGDVASHSSRPGAELLSIPLPSTKGQRGLPERSAQPQAGQPGCGEGRGAGGCALRVWLGLLGMCVRVCMRACVRAHMCVCVYMRARAACA